MSSVLSEENQYSRFSFRNFEKVHIIVIYSQKVIATLEYADLVQKLENVLKPDPIFAFAYIDIDQYPSSIELFKVTKLPTIVVSSNPEVFAQESLNVNPTTLFSEIKRFIQPFREGFQAEQATYMERCKRMVEESKVLVFIKGTPEQPKCKFTRQLLGEFRNLNLRFNFYDIDNDQGMRQWLKYYSGWKTFPQIFAQGKLIGGLDVVLDLIRKGEFLQLLPEDSVLEQLSSLAEIQALAPKLILHYGVPDIQNKNQDYKFYNVNLNTTLLKQLESRGLGGKTLLLQDNKISEFQNQNS